MGKKDKLETTEQSQEQVLIAKDFCDSKPGLPYKGRVLHYLDSKYPKQVKTFSQWEEILTTDQVID